MRQTITLDIEKVNYLIDESTQKMCIKMVRQIKRQRLNVYEVARKIYYFKLGEVLIYKKLLTITYFKQRQTKPI